MPQYRIRPGGAFRMPDGTLKEAGETIDLATDVAATHAQVLDLVPDETQAAEQPAQPE